MKLILTAPVSNLGIAGDVVDVKPGYGRNFLLPQNKAILWTKGSAKQIEGIERARDAKQIRDNEHAAEVRDALEALDVVVAARAADSGQLFGAVTPKVVAQAMKKAGGPAVDQRKLSVSKPIKTVGKHTVGIALTDAVNAHIQIEIVAAK